MIKNIFKKKSAEQLLEDKETRQYLSRRANDKKKMEGLAALKAMPKWMQKTVIRTLPKKEREVAKKLLSGEMSLEEVADPITPNKPAVKPKKVAEKDAQELEALKSPSDNDEKSEKLE